MNNVISLNLPVARTLRIKLNFKMFLISNLLVIFPLLVFCIWQLNLHTEEVYSVNTLERTLSQLSQENKVLEIKFASADSLNNIQEYIQNSNFKKVTKVEYIQLLEDTVLAK